MKLLYYSITAPVGGHLRSAVTIAEEMIARGHEVLFVTANGPGITVLQQSNIPYTVLPSEPLNGAIFNWKDFLPLYKIIKEYHPVVVHTFLGGLPQLAIITKFLKIKFVSTICGGRPQKTFPIMVPITVFSDELKDWLVSVAIPPAGVHVIPGRMRLDPPKIDTEVTNYLEKIGVPKDAHPVVMMICRTDKRKSAALIKYFNAAKVFGERFEKSIFVHIGLGNDEKFYQEISERVIHINSKANKKLIISTAFGSENPAKLLHLAHYVVGMGRSAFESMAAGKPTLVLSNEGYGGLVRSENIKNLAYYNFTGRGQRKIINEDHIDLANDLSRLEDDPFRAEEAGKFARKWFESNLSVKPAADEYEKIYLLSFSSYLNMSLFEILKHIIRETFRMVFITVKKQI